MGYEVGYGRPPKRAQFKPGQSGNPKGRPRRSVSVETLLKQSLFQLVMVADKNGGVRKKVPLLEVIFHQVAQKAALGDLKPFAQVLRMMDHLSQLIARAERASDDPQARARIVSAKLQEIFANAVPEPEDASPSGEAACPAKGPKASGDSDAT